MIKHFVLIFILFTSYGFAQPLAQLLPAETLLALGMQDLQSHEAKLEPFIAEFERLGLAEALTALVPAEEMDAETSDVLAQFSDLEPLDFLGQEAWIGVSASQFNPIPAVTLLTRLNAKASDQVSSLIADTVAQEGLDSFSEGDYTFYQLLIDDANAPVTVTAFALADDLLMLSSNPDTLRSVLRQLGGASEPNLSNSANYESTLGSLGNGNFYGYLNLAQIPNAIRPFSQGFGFDQLISRLSQAFTTAGTMAGVARVTGEGIETESLQAVNKDGGDASLYKLLTTPAAADKSSISLTPTEALSWTSNYTDLQGWWDYLNEISSSTPELGGDLDTLLTSFVGIDLRASFFSWAGDQISTISTGVGDVIEPGVPSGNLLGESVYIITTNDEAAAQSGLASLFQSIGSSVASFADPSGGSGNAQLNTQDIGGVSVTQYDITDGVALSYAVADGQVFIGTSDDAMKSVLSTRAGGETAEFESLLNDAPANASSLSLANNQVTLQSTAQLISSQLQMSAGLAGAGNLDFDAVEDASAKFEEFVQFVAARLGLSLSYAERRDGGNIYGYGTTDISW